MTTPAILSPGAEYAIGRAKAGKPVVPLCWPVGEGEEARCGCGQGHTGRDIGKAPIGALVPHGYKDATASVPKVTGWFLKHPRANVGEPLEANGWLAVDPDTDPAQAEAHKLGLSPTLTRKSRQPAFIYRRPADCPATSVKKRGKSGAIDVLADGYLVTFGRHKDGHRIELVGDTVAPAPPWTVEWLRKAAAKRDKKRSAGVGPGIGDADEPPVLLDEYGLQVWRGELFKAHPDGTVERSGSLVKLGRVLYDAGATRRTIVLALAERDETLGWRKYTGRPDAEQQYLAVFAELESKGRNARTAVLSPPTGSPDPTEGQAAVEAAEHIVAGGRCPDCPCCGRLKAIEAAIGAEGLNPATRVVTIGAILELDGRKDWKRPSKIERATEAPEGFRIVSRDRIAKRVGLTPAAVGRHLKVAVKAGILRQKVVGLPAGHPDVVTGEVIEHPRRYTALALIGSADDALAAMRTVTVERPDWGGADRNQGTCRKHPLAGTYERARRTIHCDVCNEILQSEQLVPTGETPPTYASVALTQVQVVPTGAKAAAARHRAYKEADDLADRATARELAEALARLDAKATPATDGEPPVPLPNGHAPAVRSSGPLRETPEEREHYEAIAEREFAERLGKVVDSPPPNGSANGHHPPDIPEWVKHGDWATRARWERQQWKDAGQP
jgi:hypothetical protein